MHETHFFSHIPASLRIFALFALLLGCNQGKPDHILETEAFIPVLRDILIADNGVEALGLDVIGRNIERERRYQIIYKKYQLTPETFLQNFEYYREKPEVMDEMYARIVDDLSEMLADKQLPVNPVPMPAFTPSPR
jgi:hypothetical protein